MFRGARGRRACLRLEERALAGASSKVVGIVFSKVDGEKGRKGDLLDWKAWKDRWLRAK